MIKYPTALDKEDIKEVFEMWLRYQEKKGFMRDQIQIDCLLMQWANMPHLFKDACLASIANGWKNLYPPTTNGYNALPRASQEARRGPQSNIVAERDEPIKLRRVK